jgi:hypothetical protein
VLPAQAVVAAVKTMSGPLALVVLVAEARVQ